MMEAINIIFGIINAVGVCLNIMAAAFLAKMIHQVQLGNKQLEERMGKNE